MERRSFQVTILAEDEVLGQHTFQQNVITIGRDADCDLIIDHKVVSRHHAELLRKENGFAVFAHKTTNATTVNGVTIDPGTNREVRPEDEIIVAGRYLLKLVVGHDVLPPDGVDESPTPRVGLPRPPKLYPSDSTSAPATELAVSRRRADAPAGATPPSGQPRPTKAHVRSPPAHQPELLPPEDGEEPPTPQVGSRRPTEAYQRAPKPTEVYSRPVTPPAAPPPQEVACSPRPRSGPPGATLTFRLNEQDRSQQIHDDLYVGSASECDVVLQGAFAPRKAAIIVRMAGAYRIYNTGPSPETVTVNGQVVPHQVVLRDRDQVLVYGLPLRFFLKPT